MSKNPLSNTKTIALHLLPGVVIMLVFSVIAAWAAGNDLPIPLALLITWILAGIPVELGIMLYQGFRLNHRLTLTDVILYKERTNRRTLLWLIPLLVVWALSALTVLTPSASKIMLAFFSWYPDHLLLSDFAQNIGSYPRAIVWVVLILSGVLNVVVPIVEEMYFRGFLLPRMSSQEKWAPLLNSALFSLYHFWLPWEFFSRIIALLPMTYAVWSKKDLRIGIWVHCLINSIGTLGLLVFILGQ